MPQFNKRELDEQAKEYGFIRDTFEKVLRLERILEYVYSQEDLMEHLLLKGGTAINLTVFNLPRLSVDIDLDFIPNLSKEETSTLREEIAVRLKRYMSEEGYILSEGSRFSHSLDSFHYNYINAAGNRDMIKIEINYSMRCHVLPMRVSNASVDLLKSELKVRTLAPEELFGSKIKTLMDRTAARDLYDIHNMIQSGIISESNRDLLRKCALFYHAVGSTGGFQGQISFDNIDILTFSKIRQTLLPVLRKSERIDLEGMKAEVKTYLKDLLVLTENETEFLHSFELGEYHPELLFDDSDIIRRIENHPMALWKCNMKR